MFDGLWPFSAIDSRDRGICSEEQTQMRFVEAKTLKGRRMKFRPFFMQLRADFWIEMERITAQLSNFASTSPYLSHVSFFSISNSSLLSGCRDIIWYNITCTVVFFLFLSPPPESISQQSSSAYFSPFESSKKRVFSFKIACRESHVSRHDASCLVRALAFARIGFVVEHVEHRYSGCCLDRVRRKRHHFRHKYI